MTAVTQSLAEVALAFGLKPEEFELIVQRLNREPNELELGVFSVMWSEHCSYKSSRRHLAKFPTSGRASHPGARRERRRRRYRRRTGGGVQDGIPQSSIVHRALSGRGDGRRRHHARRFHDGGPPHRSAECLAVRRSREPQDPPPGRRRGRRDRRLRQLRRRADSRRRDQFSPRLRRQHPGQRHVRRPGRRRQDFLLRRAGRWPAGGVFRVEDRA